jgi:hypothetical protein
MRIESMYKHRVTDTSWLVSLILTAYCVKTITRDKLSRRPPRAAFRQDQGTLRDSAAAARCTGKSPSSACACTVHNYSIHHFTKQLFDSSFHKAPRPEEHPGLWLRRSQRGARDITGGRSQHRPHGDITAAPHASLASSGHRSSGSRAQVWRPQTGTSSHAQRRDR